MLACLVPSGSSRGEPASLPLLLLEAAGIPWLCLPLTPVSAPVLVSPPPPMTLTFFPPSSRILACDQISKKPEKYPHLKISKLVTWFQAMNILGDHYSSDPTHHLH